ncbi:hypothetical protein [Lacticaseibacillus kribbianus]|uniref:hypothetical protein n=1 Tax=Lacticaseibacillus kribbianus TaxID=2926292 RepID=UPI001CD5EA60|nr:hypothetical protein [Lacticaseibacillus kribbianus]
MKTKLFTALLAASTLGLAPLNAVAAGETSAQGTLKTTVGEKLDINFPAGNTSGGVLVTGRDNAGTFAKFYAIQRLQAKSNYAASRLEVTASTNPLMTPDKQSYKLFVRNLDEDTTLSMTTWTMHHNGTPNNWSTFAFYFLSDRIPLPNGDQDSPIAGEYSATVDYKITSTNRS